MGSICLYGHNAPHEKALNLHYSACGFNGEKQDQLDWFYTKHCILDDLVHAVGWSRCECSASRIPLSLVCLVDCRLPPHPSSGSLPRRAQFERKGSGVARGEAGCRTGRIVRWQKSKAGLLHGWCGSSRPPVTRSQLSRWKAREQEVEVERGARGRGRREESRDDQICHHCWLARPNYGNGFTPLTTSARAIIMKSFSLSPCSLLKLPLLKYKWPVSVRYISLSIGLIY